MTVSCDLTEPAPSSDETRSRSTIWIAVRGFSLAEWSAIALVAIGVARVADVTLAGIVTNDSLGYLRRADDPLGAGFVSQGYRQAAYPLLMRLSNIIGDLFGWDHIFGVALVQRTLLVVALVVAVWAMRWWSVPIVAFGTSRTFVVHADLLLPEGTLIPLCMLVGALGAAAAMGRLRDGRHAALATAVAFAASSLAASIKLQYAVLFAIAAAAAWTLVRDRMIGRRFAIAVASGSVLFVVLLATAQSFENRSELGVFEPVSERARAEWYGAWQAVFGLHPDNRSDPDLAEFYDGGNLYTFLHGIEQRVPEYTDRAPIMRDRVEDMFAAADTSARREQVSAFFGALRAGRMDDIGGIITRALDAGADADARLLFNRVGSESGGSDAVVRGYNDGFGPGSMTFGPVLSPAQGFFGDHRGSRDWVAVASIVTMLGGLAAPGRHRPVVLATLVVLVGSSAALASGYIDNARYLLGPFCVNVIGGAVALQAIVRSSAARDLARRLR